MRAHAGAPVPCVGAAPPARQEQRHGKEEPSGGRQPAPGDPGHRQRRNPAVRPRQLPRSPLPRAARERHTSQAAHEPLRDSTRASCKPKPLDTNTRNRATPTSRSAARAAGRAAVVGARGGRELGVLATAPVSAAVHLVAAFATESAVSVAASNCVWVRLRSDLRRSLISMVAGLCWPSCLAPPGLG
jgi:hypothetical protein